MPRIDLPKKVRLSIGSAILLGLAKGMLDAEPTTIYMLTYRRGKCLANCAFCPQSRETDGRSDMLSRVVWPVFHTEDVILCISKAFKDGKIQRACIQALNYPSVQEDIDALARGIRSMSDVPISVSCQPLVREDMVKLAQAGVNRISIALDAVTKDLFEKVKGAQVGGPYSWDSHLKALEEAVKIFGRNSVTTHLMVGLGEKEEEMARAIQNCVNLGVYPALFAFTPIAGTIMMNCSQPPIDCYRRVQIAHYLMTRQISLYEKMKFREGRLIDFGLSREELKKIIRTGEPFRTSGCPGCNRPYYNERAGGPIYNYPRKPTAKEIAEIEEQILNDLC